jgi:hypothetical protein
LLYEKETYCITLNNLLKTARAAPDHPAISGYATSAAVAIFKKLVDVMQYVSFSYNKHIIAYLPLKTGFKNYDSFIN